MLIEYIKFSTPIYVQLIQKRLSFGNLKFKLQNTKYKKKYVTWVDF